MDIFVQSRGRSPDFEYCWQPEVPPQLSRISSLIQSESPSVILARLEKKLILLTTGLESREKKDFRDRPIRHSIFWRCNDNSHDETTIRAIAVQALRGLLSDQVDKYINLGGENGFEASFAELKNLSNSFLEIESQNLPVELEDSQIGKNSQGLRDDLAYQLQHYSLPKGCELIVVATGVKSEDSLEKAGAWRSLSNLVKSENWRNLSRGEIQQSSFFGVAIAIIVAVIAIIALILLIVLLHPLTPKPKVTPPPTPTTSPPNQTMETMKKTSQILQKSFSTSLEQSKEEFTPSANSETNSKIESSLTGN